MLLTMIAMAAAAPEAPGARDRATVLMNDHPGYRGFQNEYGYADAVVIDGTVYLSGVVMGQRPGETLIEAQQQDEERDDDDDDDDDDDRDDDDDDDDEEEDDD